MLTAFAQNLTARSVPPLFSDTDFCFVVGCGHSGTTLTAAKLGNHPSAWLIGRETDAFSPGIGALASRMVALQWSEFAHYLHKQMVIEKTPKHIHSVKRIRRILPQARFLVVLRNPLDNIASLYRRFGDLDYSIERWNMDNRPVPELMQVSYCKVVRYEQLTTNPEHEFRSICACLGLSWDDRVLDSGETAYDRFDQAGNMALRTEQVARPIARNVGTWKHILNNQQSARVLRRTRHLVGKIGYEKLRCDD